MTSHFVISPTPLSGVNLIKREPIGDERGYLERMFCIEEMTALLDDRKICQINHTYTKEKGTVRGLHFQYPPAMEMKFVQCIKGRVFDVAVDLRKSSPTFLNYYSTILEPENHQTLLIPEGVAHGLQTLADDCELIYFHTACYRPESEGVIDAADKKLSIDWPLPITVRSDRDKNKSVSCRDFPGIEV